MINRKHICALNSLPSPLKFWKKKKKKPYMEYTDKKRRRRGSAHMPIQRINSKKHQNCINNNNVLKN